MLSIPCVICAARPQAVRFLVLLLRADYFGRPFQRLNLSLSLLQLETQLRHQLLKRKHQPGTLNNPT
ncbi:hypothetical protein D3C77_733400 [compost metagenome]